MLRVQCCRPGVPGGRWLTILMNRIDPGLFSDAFTAWVGPHSGRSLPLAFGGGGLSI
jgi:hypothetical protein